MQIVEAIFGAGRVPEGPVPRAARAGAEAEFAAVFDAETADAATAPEVEVPDLGTMAQAPFNGESLADARPRPAVGEMAVQPEVDVSGTRPASGLPLAAMRFPPSPSTAFVPVLVPREEGAISSTPETADVFAAPASADPPIREAQAEGDLARVIAVQSALPEDTSPAAVSDVVDEIAAAEPAKKVADVGLSTLPETGAREQAWIDQPLPAARDVPTPPVPPDGVAVRSEGPVGSDVAPRPGADVTTPQDVRQVPLALQAPEGPRLATAESRAREVAPGQAEHPASRRGEAVPPALPSVASPAAQEAVSSAAPVPLSPVARAPASPARPAATPAATVSAAPDKPAQPQPAAIPSAPPGANPVEAAAPTPLSEPVAQPQAVAPSPELPVVRPDTPVRVLPDTRKAHAPEPAAVAPAPLSPGATQRLPVPAEVTAPAPAHDRAASRETPDPAGLATAMAARILEAAPAVPQGPDIVIQIDAPDVSTPRAAEPAGLTGTSAPAAAPDADVRRAVLDQLVATVRATNAGTVEILLSPEELGQVRLDMKMVDGVMTVRIDADRPETLDLMRRGADVLFRELRDAGFGALNLSFGSGTPQRGGFASSSDGNGQSDRNTHLDVQAATAPNGAARGLGPARLDIRI